MEPTPNSSYDVNKNTMADNNMNTPRFLDILNIRDLGIHTYY